MRDHRTEKTEVNHTVLEDNGQNKEKKDPLNVAAVSEKDMPNSKCFEGVQKHHYYRTRK